MTTPPIKIPPPSEYQFYSFARYKYGGDFFLKRTRTTSVMVYPEKGEISISGKKFKKDFNGTYDLFKILNDIYFTITYLAKKVDEKTSTDNKQNLYKITIESNFKQLTIENNNGKKLILSESKYHAVPFRYFDDVDKIDLKTAVQEKIRKSNREEWMKEFREKSKREMLELQERERKRKEDLQKWEDEKEKRRKEWELYDKEGIIPKGEGDELTSQEKMDWIINNHKVFKGKTIEYLISFEPITEEEFQETKGLKNIENKTQEEQSRLDYLFNKYIETMNFKTRSALFFTEKIAEIVEKYKKEILSKS